MLHLRCGADVLPEQGVRSRAPAPVVLTCCPTRQFRSRAGRGWCWPALTRDSWSERTGSARAVHDRIDFDPFSRRTHRSRGASGHPARLAISRSLRAHGRRPHGEQQPGGATQILPSRPARSKACGCSTRASSPSPRAAGSHRRSAGRSLRRGSGVDYGAVTWALPRWCDRNGLCVEEAEKATSRSRSLRPTATTCCDCIQSVLAASPRRAIAARAPGLPVVAWTAHA